MPVQVSYYDNTRDFRRVDGQEFEEWINKHPTHFVAVGYVTFDQAEVRLVIDIDKRLLIYAYHIGIGAVYIGQSQPVIQMKPPMPPFVYQMPL